MSNRNEVAKRREAPLRTPTLLSPDSVQKITAQLKILLAELTGQWWKEEDVEQKRSRKTP